MAPFARLESSDLFLNSIGILLADLIASIMARDSLLEPFKSEITLGRGAPVVCEISNTIVVLKHYLSYYFIKYDSLTF